ncbi:MAG: DUF5916 domain-containing protein [Gammaproteobacteria bacterium]
MRSAPGIDGVIDPQEWAGATVIEDFKVTSPHIGMPPSQRTVAYVGRDARNFYIAVRCYDTAPDRILAHNMRRDSVVFGDDWVIVTLDTFYDHRTAYNFITNPIGLHRDSRVEEDVTVRGAWDAIWVTHATIDDSGWSTEMRIPFASISANPATDRWGINIGRMIARTQEQVRWANISHDSESFDPARLGIITGLSALDIGKGLDFIPASTVRVRRRDPGGHQALIFKPGFEAVYKIQPALNASLIVNPDFSDTDVDDLQTNLTRFALFFPEQRDFFVRDADIFEFGGLRQVNGIPYFSRRIGLPGNTENPDPLDLDVGVKLSGRVGRYTLGLLNTQMAGTDVFDAKNLTVARASMDIAEGSRAGVIATHGNPFANDDNSLAGADFHHRGNRLRGGTTYTIDGFAMRSFSAGRDGDDLAFGMGLSLPNDRHNARLEFIELQSNFNPALGFVNRTGIRQYDGSYRFRYRPRGSRSVRNLDWGVDFKFVTDIDNELETVKVAPRVLSLDSAAGDHFEAYYNYRQERLNQPYAISDLATLPVGQYSWHNGYGYLETSPLRPVSVRFEWVVGQFYDGTQKDFLYRLDWRPSPRVFVSLEHRMIETDLREGAFDIEINRAKLILNLTPHLSWINHLQHITESHYAILHSQLRWEYRPGAEMNVTVNQDWSREDGRYEGRRGDFFVKLFWTQRF